MRHSFKVLMLLTSALLVIGSPALSSGDTDVVVKAKIFTSMGIVEARLFAKDAPKTVSNFVTLARSGFYKGIVFHRVIPKFMIQTGDPKGDGTGGPGYTFADEIGPSLKHSKAGMLSMANAGPNTNGSQFFITVAPAPQLDGRHAVFGEVTSGLEVAVKISEVETAGTKPKKEVKIDKIEILGAFEPVEVEKVKELAEEEIKKIAQKPAEKLLRGIGEAQELGVLQNAKFLSFMARGRMAQVSFNADFDKAKGTRIILLGEVKAANFEVQDLQFSKGKAQ